MARAWARASGGKDEAADDLAAFGIADREAHDWLGDEEDDGIGVLPEAWPAVEAFMALSTQWRHAGLDGVRVGLDYAAIEPTLRLMGKRLSRDQRADLFSGLQTMEVAALEEMSRRR